MILLSLQILQGSNVIKLTNIIICKSSAEKLSSLRIYPVVDFLLIARLMYNNIIVVQIQDNCRPM